MSNFGKILWNFHEQYGLPCPYCNNQMRGKRRRPTRDHITPRSKGGTLANGNALVVCAKCNSNKGNMTIEEFHKHLVDVVDYRADAVANTMKSVPPEPARMKSASAPGWEWD